MPPTKKYFLSSSFILSFITGDSSFGVCLSILAKGSLPMAFKYSLKLIGYMFNILTLPTGNDISLSANSSKEPAAIT